MKIAPLPALVSRAFSLISVVLIVVMTLSALSASANEPAKLTPAQGKALEAKAKTMVETLNVV